jgi:hypothetical protein
MTLHKAEDVLAGLGCTLDLTDNQQVVDVVVLARVSDFERGGTALAVGVTPGVDWIIQGGLLRAALNELDMGTMPDAFDPPAA